MKKSLVFSIILLLGLVPAAGHAVTLPGSSAPAVEMLAQEEGQFPVKPSQAALIAQHAFPGSKVLNVKLLPSGEYAVTLKAGGSVQRVLVNATSGAIG